MTEPIFPCLWFDGNAKEAAIFYCNIFPNSRIISENMVVVIFELNGNKFMGMNGGPKYKFNESVSFSINCKNQDEIDYYWSSLVANGGEEVRCGWLKDKFGVSWQVVPSELGEWMSNPDRAPKVGAALIQMIKLDYNILKNA